MQTNSLLQEVITTLKGNKILLCPLNWGLGHATRCVPIVNALIQAGKEVVVAADGFALEFLKQEFPHLQTIKFSGMQVEYSNSDSQNKILAKKIPYFIKSIATEHKQLQKIVAQHHINTVISDNRFGLWHKHIETVYITHQLLVKMPPELKFAERFVWHIHRRIISKYNHCWIPDVSGKDNLSGDLSHLYPLPKNAAFVGWLSRFQQQPQDSSKTSPYEVVALLSGPEPQRSILEQKLVNYLQRSLFPSLIVRGIPSKITDKMKIANIDLISHINTQELQQLIVNAPTVICRSGYSTLMDLMTLGKKAVLIPTPGQTEQEYLAENLKEKGFKILLQNEL